MRDRGFLTFCIGPALGYLMLFFLVPLAIVLAYGFLTRDVLGGMSGPLTLASFRRALDPLYVSVLVRSVRLAALTTLICLILGYPVASAVTQLRGRARALALMLVVVPSWMNLLIKNYAWIVVLRREGLINGVLRAAGLIDEPLPLLFNEWAVLVGLVHTHLPFTVLPIYAALERLDPRLLDAARDLGAGAWMRFRRVVLPQVKGGILVGSVLVFVPALGAFVTPDLLGGAKGLMVANLIQNQVLEVRDWPFGSALSALLMAVVLAALLFYMRFAGRVGEERVL